MANIPTIALSGVPAHQLGVKADAGPLMASSQAREGAWRTVGQAAQVFAGIAKQRQDHIDRGTLASEDSIRQQTASAVSKYMDENQGEPEKWAKFHEQTWKAYESERNKRAKGWSPQLIEEDNIRMQGYKADTDIRFQTEQNRALIRKANAQIEANANLRLDNGDIEGAVGQINSMNLAPEAKRAKLDQVINGGIYRQYDRLLTDTAQLPPARQIEEFKKIEAGLVNRDAKGNYTSGVLKDANGAVLGGMGEPARLDVLRNVRSAVRHANVQMAQTGSALVRKIELGDDPNLIFQRALANGEITPEVAAVFVPEAKAAVDSKNDVLAARRDRGEQAVMAEINRKGGTRMTMQEIERRQAIGITRPNDPQGLTGAAAQRARQELEAIQESEWDSIADQPGPRNQLEKMLGQGITTKFWDRAQMTPEEQNDMLSTISTGVLSTGTKSRLMQLFFEVQKWDLRESEISDVDGDRDISPEEKELRTTLIERYRGNSDALSAQALGARYMADMEEVGNWYRSNKNATPAQRAAKAKELSEKLGRDLDHEAGSSILGSIPAFQ